MCRLDFPPWSDILISPGVAQQNPIQPRLTGSGEQVHCQTRDTANGPMTPYRLPWRTRCSMREEANANATMDLGWLDGGISLLVGNRGCRRDRQLQPGYCRAAYKPRTWQLDALPPQLCRPGLQPPPQNT